VSDQVQKVWAVSISVLACPGCLVRDRQGQDIRAAKVLAASQQIAIDEILQVLESLQ
jgi:hypothetical protein